VRAEKLDWVRSEIARMLRHLGAQEREIQVPRRAGVPTAAAELVLSRMQAKVDHLCREREALRRSGTSLSGRSGKRESGGASTRRSQLSCIDVSKEEDGRWIRKGVKQER
jgi:hypothetical protein